MSGLLAVDPGLTGALALYDGDLLAVHDMPVVKGGVDAASLAALIGDLRPTAAIVELVGAMPKQGVASTFKFGHGVGIVHGVIAALGLPMHLVTPAKWKRFLSLDADKEKARALALRMWPGKSDLFRRVKDHGRAEAALLARYAHMAGILGPDGGPVGNPDILRPPPLAAGKQLRLPKPSIPDAQL